MITVTIAFFPVLGHLRMRETLAAVRRLSRTGAAEPNNELQEKIVALELNTAEIRDEIAHLSTKKDANFESGDLASLVSEIRRESRLARIAAAQINGAL